MGPKKKSMISFYSSTTWSTYFFLAVMPQYAFLRHMTVKTIAVYRPIDETTFVSPSPNNSCKSFSKSLCRTAPT